jgi:Phosphotransferase enzyme family
MASTRLVRSSLEQVVRVIAGPQARLVDWTAEPVAYAVLTPSTAALERVRVRLDCNGHEQEQWLFVKTLQSLRRWHLFPMIPEALRETALAGYPWRVEAELYASDVLEALPPLLRAPRVYLIEDLGDEQLRIWMEHIQTVEATWDHERYAAAARALGHLAGSRLAAPGGQDGYLRSYFETRLLGHAIPLLRDAATWEHPLVASAADLHLREDLLALAARMPALLTVLDKLPVAFAHGDACPQNLLAAAGEDGLVAVDWGMAGMRPVGHDLSQLLAGRAEAGLLEADDLLPLDRCIVAGYLQGLRQAGANVPEAQVRAGYVGSLAVRSAFTCVPVEQLGSVPTPALSELFRRRLAFGRFVVHLAATTLPVGLGILRHPRR